MSDGGDAVSKRWLAAPVVMRLIVVFAMFSSGFRAVSDDDYARVTIAQAWARAPLFDATGTSWLPFPFWLTGSAMMVFGRSLAVARGVAVASGVVATLLVFVAARWLGAEPKRAIAAATLSTLVPWVARLGVATVPELLTASLALVGIASISSRNAATSRRALGGLALFAATLSRYEAWPIAFACALIGGFDAARSRRPTFAIGTALALAGPLTWLAWNRHAHGDATHFLARVAAYKQALGVSGGSQETALSRLAAYPVALLREAPEVVLPSAMLMAWKLRRGALEGAARSLGIAVFLVLALALAMVKDGAPTHHPERALLVVMLLLVAIAVALPVRPAHVAAFIAAGAVGALGVHRATDHEAFVDRGAEERAGKIAQEVSKPGERVLLEITDYGYFASMAALGRPEDVERDRSIDPRDAKTASSFDETGTLAARATRCDARWLIARDSVTVRALATEVPGAAQRVWRMSGR
jgi:hypothetical protein